MICSMDCTGGNEFGSIGGGLNGGLLLGVPVEDSLVEQVKDACDGSTVDKVVV